MDLALPKVPVVDIMLAQKPTRVAVFLRMKSPLYAHSHEEIVQKTCSAIGVQDRESRKLLAVQKWPQLTILVFDIFYDEYEVSKAHHRKDLPVLLADYGKRLSFVKVASSTFQEQVNTHVADQHNYNGWDGKPPYFEDQTSPAPRKYDNPRDTSIL